LTNRETNKDGLLWPVMLLTGALINVSGMAAAVANGDGDNSIAFKTGLFAGFIFAASHIVKVGQILCERSRNELDQTDTQLDLESVTPAKWTDRINNNNQSITMNV